MVFSAIDLHFLAILPADVLQTAADMIFVSQAIELLAHHFVNYSQIIPNGITAIKYNPNYNEKYHIQIQSAVKIISDSNNVDYLSNSNCMRTPAEKKILSPQTMNGYGSHCGT